MAVYVYFDNREYTQKIAYNASGFAEYVGIAKPGTATSSAGWQIKKMTYDASNRVTDVKWAGGNAKFNKIWDSRATYSYS